MEAEAVIAALRAHRAELEAAGILHAGVFGSVARGEARPDSDVDILVDLAKDRPLGVYDFVGLQERIADLVGTKVDLVNRAALRPRMRENVLQDLVSAF
jgi:predicted nucleotidyltransferase